MEEIVLHDADAFDVAAELDLYAAQLSAQLRAARNYSLLITDKTVMNVTAYARLVLDTSSPYFKIAGEPVPEHVRRHRARQASQVTEPSEQLCRRIGPC